MSDLRSTTLGYSPSEFIRSFSSPGNSLNGSIADRQANSWSPSAAVRHGPGGHR